jgi:hypothetical protein
VDSRAVAGNKKDKDNVCHKSIHPILMNDVSVATTHYLLSIKIYGMGDLEGITAQRTVW